MKKLIALLLTLGMLCTLTACGGEKATSSAEKKYDYPAKTITMIVPYGAGGTTDVVGRQFAVALGKVLGVNIVIENQAGASGSIGCQAALDADSDGSVVLFTAESLGTQRVMGISSLSYADYKPVAAVANDPKVIVVNGNSRYNTIQDLLADIRSNPGTVQMSYTGPGGSGHVQALIMDRFGYTPALTAYSSGSDCYVAVMSDQVVFTNSNYSTVASFIENGDLKLLAVAATERMADFPDVPALSEVMEGSDPYLAIPYTPLSLLVSAEMDESIVEILRAASAEAVHDPEFETFMEENHVDKLYKKYTTVEEMNKFYSEWESTVSWLLYDAGAATHSPEEFNIPRQN